jgi:peroxiredoxin
MAALATGTKAPEFELKSLDGKKFSLGDELARGAVVLAFFKVSCPTCQYALPFLERLYKAYGRHGAAEESLGLKPGSKVDADAALKGRSSTGASSTVSMVGISQNDAKETAAFTQQFGITFPVLLDDTRSYPVSNAYGLTNVPSIFLIAPDGEIEVSSVGWVKADFEEINRRMAEAGKIAPAVMFKPEEDVRDFRAG